MEFGTAELGLRFDTTTAGTRVVAAPVIALVLFNGVVVDFFNGNDDWVRLVVGIAAE